MLGKKIINTGGVACTTDTAQILDAQLTQSTALYRFEDNANDTASSTGKFNKGGVFNGSSSKIALPAILPTSSTADSSVSFWFKYSGGQSGTGTLFSSYGGSSAQPGYHLGLEAAYTYGGVSYPDGSLYLTGYSMGTGSGVNGTTSYADGNWHHVVVTYDFSTGVLSCFVDNASSATLSVTYSSRPSTIGPFSQSGDIGYQLHGGPHRYAKCSIDQFRIFDKDLSTSERTTLYNETTTTANTLQVLGDTSCVAAYTFEGNADDLDTATPKNGNATNVIYDYSGTESNITYTTGKFGKAAVFNGSSSVVTINSLFDFSSSFSISMWFNADTLPSGTYTPLFFTDGYGGSNSDYGIAFYLYGNTIKPWIDRQGTYTNIFTAGTLSTGTWYHVLLNRDYNSKWELFLNGSSLGTYTSAGLTDNYTPNSFSTIGKHANSALWFDGKIDQTRIFDKTLNTGEVNSLYNETTTTAALGTVSNPSTIAYYKMQDATDETGSYNGTATNVDFNVQGKYGFAGKFNGSSSVIATSLNPNASGGARSFSVWIKTTSTAFQSIINNGGASHASGLNMFVYNNKLFATSGKGNGENYGPTSSASINTGNWVHCVLTMNGTAIGSTLKTYVNGTLDGTHTTTVLITDTYNAFTIGGRNLNGSYASSYFNGEIDQVRIFNKAISADEVTKLYNEIQCAPSIATPESYFNTKLYTGNGNTQALTGVGFTPGLTWVKARDDGNDNVLVDSVNGAGSAKGLVSNTNYTEGAYTATYGYISSLDNDGFTVSTGSSYANYTNKNNENYVAWNWKAGSSNVTNNDGTIASTVSASPESGFSIATYAGNGTMGATIGHGLNTTPELILVKLLSGISPKAWTVYASALGADKYMYLDYNYAAGPYNFWNSTLPTSSVFSVSTDTNVNSSSGNYVAYCFANVDGHQRIGSYVGNGSANGPFIYTGFEPAWIMIKRTDAAGAWNIFDNKRNSTNPRNSILQADKSDQEYTNTAYNFNFYTNGFQPLNTVADWNASNGSYIFLAIAANPDTTAPTKANSFKTVLYTGTGSSQSITGVGFAPDMTWIKGRSVGYSHSLQDTLRGPGTSTSLYTELNVAQGTYGTYGQISAFGDDGFTVASGGHGVYGNAQVNQSGVTYASWNWKALDHDRDLATINTDGTIPSLVSANTEAGFSIVKATFNTSSPHTVGHGLSSAPEIIFSKRTSTTGDWFTYSKFLDSTEGEDYFIKLNGTDTRSDSAHYWNDTAPTNDVFTTGAIYDQSETVIFYCWHSVAGYSKISSYAGSGASGKEVALDFSPSFVMIKRTNAAAGWVIIDDQRGSKELYPHAANAEDASTTNIVLGTNKFTLNTAGSWYNASGGNYLYMAFK